ncbi:P-loop containing nucleoside triphosphate hydrolase protein [Chaetomium tenue]|uniref:P-loop containing nucleoside triphosphate hydrolase protein n=1 Tax=Chaetomium tenue TaxID=1854479 RepID=A0ACB7NXR2_9PEZI|nr:P-loop containing nucleoside triphosphate hydrolase protein [Chaetomium globosum]
MDPNASSITVAVRVRPFTIREAAQLVKNDDTTLFLGDGSLAAAPTPKLHQRGLRPVIKVVDDRCLVFDPPEDSPVQKFTRSVVPAAGKKVKDQVFAFDRIFDQTACQSDVYEGTTKGLLDSILDGYNATVFAYGATGCGKTHTITGTAQHPGIIFLTMQELFEKIGERSGEKTTEVSLSYLEIYNETIRDLLVPGGSKQGLMLREDSNQAVTVAGLTSHHPKDVQEVMDMIVQGNEYRTVSPTAANAVSSRSHAVLQINIAQKDRNAAVNEPHTMATLSIIDLAGSERASATKNRGERLLEGANINKSLLALGSCINALCDPRKKNHVPYRNSKLTRLLKFSLGGNCKTVMIVCVSPSSEHFDETQNTLRYANRAKNIQTKVTRNVFNVNRHVKDFLVKIDEQMALIKELKAQQKDAEKTFFVKFRKQMDKRDAVVREGILRLRAAYEHASSERLEKINFMKKLKAVERRISLLSAWIAAFDSVCDARGDEQAMPSNLVAMRKTAHGILMELESSRHHIHQRIERTNWERALDTALNHSISQLPTGDGVVDGSERDTLAREVEMLKTGFMRDAYREVLEQDKAGDAAVLQVLLTAQFDILSSMSETLSMSEEEAVAHAKTMISRLLETGYSAASHVVKPDGSMMPVELFPPTKRGTPKRKKSINVNSKAIPGPVFSAAQQQAIASPMKASPRRRKLGARKSVAFTPAKKKPSVRWRDDESEQGTLADFEKTPQKFPSPAEPSPEKALPTRPPVPSYLSHLDSPKSSSPTPNPPEAPSLSFAKPNRFQAGFLSKGRPPQQSGGSANGSPVPPTFSLNLTSSDNEDRPSPLRTLPVSRATNSLSPVAASNGSPKPSNNLLSTLTENGNENEPPRRASPSRLPRISYGSGSESDLDPLKIRSALHSAKRRERLSLLPSTTVSSAKRVSSVGSNSGGGGNVSGSGSIPSHHGAHRRASASYSGGTTHASASASNGISRHRRGSTERGARRSPPRPIPITCSPPASASAGSSPAGAGRHHHAQDLGGPGRNLTPGQARRMNMGGSLRLEKERGSPTALRSIAAGVGAGVGPGGGFGAGSEGDVAGVGGKARRITIGAGGVLPNVGGGGGSGSGGSVLKPRPSMVWR